MYDIFEEIWSSKFKFLKYLHEDQMLLNGGFFPIVFLGFSGLY